LKILGRESRGDAYFGAIEIPILDGAQFGAGQIHVNQTSAQAAVAAARTLSFIACQTIASSCAQLMRAISIAILEGTLR